MLLSAIILSVAAIVVMDIPAVQNRAVSYATALLSEKLGSRVAIERIELGLFSRLKLTGLYVEDLGGDTLLYARKMDAYVTGYGVRSKGRVILRHANVEGAKLYLHEMPDGDMNIKQLINRITNPDRERKGNFKLRMSHASVKDMSLRIERRRHRNPEYGVDFGDIDIRNLNARIYDFNIDGRTIYTDIESLSAEERSGFDVERMSGYMSLTNGNLVFRNINLLTQHSELRVPYLSLSGESWADYKDFVGKVKLSGQIDDTDLDSRDIAYFAPKLRDRNISVSGMKANIVGLVSDFSANITSMRVGDGTTLKARATVKGLPDIKRTQFDVTVPQLSTSGRAASGVVRDATGKQLSEGVVRLLTNSGHINVDATFKGTVKRFKSKLTARTSKAGALRCDVDMSPAEGGLNHIEGSVAGHEFNLGTMLGKPQLLGRVTVDAAVNGEVGRGYHNLSVGGVVTDFELKGYRYDSLTLGGDVIKGNFAGWVDIDDPNLKLGVAGVANLGSDVPAYDFRVNIDKADLARLNINRRDSISHLSGSVYVNMSGASLDNMNGSVEAVDMRYRFNGNREIASDNLSIYSTSHDMVKKIDINSDFANISYKSSLSYKVAFEYLKYRFMSFVPSMKRNRITPPSFELDADRDNGYSFISVNVGDFGKIADALSEGLQVADGAYVELRFNPVSNDLQLDASSEYIQHRQKLLLTHMRLNGNNYGSDSLAFGGSIERVKVGRQLNFNHLNLKGGARAGRVHLAASFDNSESEDNLSENSTSGVVKLYAEQSVAADSSGRPTIDLYMRPSHYAMGDKRWDMQSRRVQIDSARITIDNFLVVNGNQRMEIAGVASRSRADSVVLHLDNFDLEPFTHFTERIGYRIKGRTNGYASVKSLLVDGQIAADINLDSLTVNTITAPPMELRSRWDFEKNRAGVLILNRMKRDTLVRGYFIPKDVRFGARVNIDSLELGLLDPLLKGVITNTSGLANARLRVEGDRTKTEMRGTVDIADLSTTVGYTNVKYSIPSASVAVENSRFDVKRVKVLDEEGNSGEMDFHLDLGRFTNITYNIAMQPRRMLVLNTTQEDNDFFYGKVYASGNAEVDGEKGRVDLNISARSEGGSFFMPMSDKSDIARADFVKFRKPEVDTLNVVDQLLRNFDRKRERMQTENKLNVNMTLEVQRNIDMEMTIAGDPIRARGEGVLNLIIKPRENLFSMVGTCDLIDGSYDFSLQNIINKQFKLDTEQPSSISWNGSPLDANLNINAVHEINRVSLQPLLQSTVSSEGNSTGNMTVPVECTIRLQGLLTNPDIELGVRVPSADPETQSTVENVLNTPEERNKQFLYLLLLNSFYSDSGSGGPLGDIGSTVSAATGLELLTNMLSNLISTNGYNVLLRYRPETDLTGDEVDFGLSKNLINNRLLLEAEGNYIIDNKQALTSSMSNFMGEGSITYLLDPAGALRLKAFTQTIDRFDENQGQQEWGGGIYLKEDFDNAADFRRRFKARFTNKRRQERRTLRRAVRAAEQEMEQEMEQEREMEYGQ